MKGRWEYVRKMMIGLAVAAAVATGAGTAFASSAPGPNGPNTYGLCKAYSAGSSVGQSHKHSAPPFAALAAAAAAQNETVAQYCASATPGGK